MGTWNIKISGNDTFQDIYQSFFRLYNLGQNPTDISKQIQNDFAEMFNDYDEKNNSLFGLALAQWETKSLDPLIFKQVKEIIETCSDLEFWEGHNGTTIEKRKKELDKFLVQISVERDKPKRRVRPKYEFTYNNLIDLTAQDGKRKFTVSEHFINGVYQQTGSILSCGDVGVSILYFTGQGKFISANWVDCQTLEITHDKDILFTQKKETFYHCGDQGEVIYISMNL